MKLTIYVTAFAILGSLYTVVAAGDWLQFRGTDNRSVAASEPVPAEWDDEKNVAWKVGLPGDGVSSPIVVDNRVVVTASSGPNQDRLHVLCFDVENGQLLWHRQFWATGRTLHHPTSSVAANSPASDGERIFAFFSTNDLIALDLDGNLLWLRGLTSDYPKAGNDVGMASSPVVVDSTVIVQVENQGDSFAAGIDAETGVNRWKIPRNESENWASPTVLSTGNAGQDLVLLQSGTELVAIEPRTGSTVWKFESACGTIPSAAVDGNEVYVPSEGLTALSLPAEGGDPTRLWQSNKLSAGSASPVVHDGKVYIVKRAGVLSCGEAESGDVLWQLRLKGTFWATPVLADGHLFLINQEGVAQIVRVDGEEGELVSQYDFGEQVLSSPAVADGAIYFRGESNLWKIAEND